MLPASLAGTLDLPFLQNASVSCAQDLVVANLVLHPDRERFLLDHAIGGNIRTVPSAERIYLLPLMVAIEIMAEVASLIVPDFDVVAVETVRASRRIRVEQSGCPIKVIAKLLSDNTVQVSINDAAELMSCRVRFGTRRAEGLAGRSPALPDPKITPDNLYSASTMFHGPTMQSVTSLTGVNDKLIAGMAEIKPCPGWFSDNASPQFLIDPLLLDNASQFTLYYLLEHDQNVSALLPFFIERIEFFEHPIRQGAVMISADMLAAGERATEANLTIYGGDQKVLQLDAMNSRRINLPDNWRAFIADPENNVLSSRLELPFASNEKLACFTLDQQSLPQDEAALDWCTDYVLTAKERAFYGAELKADHRRREWLSGRIASKDAVRAIVKSLIGLSLAPGDIEIAITESGKPEIEGTWQALLPRPISISISHTGGQAVAIAAHPDYSSVGVDIQTIAERDESFEATAFGAEERSLLDGNKHDRAYGIACLWAAKEAAGKLHGFGLAQCLTDVRITNANWSRDILQASVANVMETKLSINLFQIDNCILAVTTAPSHAQQLTS
jgi:phosphopantetheinyl transferase